MTNKEHQVVTGESLVQRQDWSKLCIPIKALGKISVEEKAKEKVVAFVKVAPAVVDVMVQTTHPHAEFQQHLVDRVMCFVELKHKLRIDRATRQVDDDGHIGTPDSHNCRITG